MIKLDTTTEQGKRIKETEDQYLAGLLTREEAIEIIHRLIDEGEHS